MSLVTGIINPETARIFGVSFLVLASRVIRPGHIYRLSVTNFTPQTVMTHASILRDGIDISSADQSCSPGIPETMILRVNPQALEGTYKLRIEGKTDTEEVVFSNETILEFSQRSITILVQTDKQIYRQGQVVRFRTVPITTDLKPFQDALDVFMLDPNGMIVKRWLSKQTNLGFVNLEYPLSDKPALGSWTIRVLAQGQVKDSKFIVEEYYPQQYEVKVDIPSEILETDEYISGSISSNYTNGASVVGNLTVILTTEMLGSTASATESEPLFNGNTEFRYKMSEVKRLIGHRSIDNAKLTVTAYVGERYFDTFNVGFAKVKITSSKLKLKFIRPSVYVFKPQMPFDCYLSLSYIDGSSLPAEKLIDGFLDVRVVAINRMGSAILPAKSIEKSLQSPGVWKVSVDVKSSISRQVLSTLDHLRIEASYSDTQGLRTTDIARAYPAYSPTHRSIQITTSTASAKVGNYAIFHASASYKVEFLSYVIISKGLILTTGRERIKSTPTTFAVPISADMAPTSTIVIYDVAKNTEVVMDALSFHVDGTSLHNFTVLLNPHKDKQGETIEVAVYGQPGTYVGLSALSTELNSISYAGQMSPLDFDQQMQNFDRQVGTVTHYWMHPNGKVKEILNFPSPSHSIDIKQLLDNIGLVLFTDANVPKRSSTTCSQGLTQCLVVDKCYNSTIFRCNGKDDCEDTSDESGCDRTEELIDLKLQEHLNRVNRIQGFFQENWLWKDVNIGPLGHFIFTAKLPDIGSSWSINAISMSPLHGIAMLKDPIEMSNVLPFVLNVEMPSHCNIGEQVGIRTVISNFGTDEFTVSVILASSPDYRFVEVNEAGETVSFSPDVRAQSREMLLTVAPQETNHVYIPIVAKKLGPVNVTIVASTQISRKSVSKTIIVGADGITQYTHLTIPIDLSQSSYVMRNLDTNITETPVVKYDNVRRYIFDSNRATIEIAGGVMGPILSSIPVDTNTLLRLPSDCGEQNMFNFAMNLMSMSYLRSTGQDTIEVRKEVFKNLNLLYQRQLTFRNRDGSFSVFKTSKEPSVWLTAFVTQYLHQATSQEWENYIFIDSEVIESAIGWLVTKQTLDGSFVETNMFAYDRKLDTSPKFGFNVEDYRLKNISLTAYVLIALHNARDRSGELSTKASYARNLAQKYLESMLHRSTIKTAQDPFDLALVTYALQTVNSIEADDAYNYLEKHMYNQGGMRYWSPEPTIPTQMTSQNQRVLYYPKSRGNYDSRSVQTTAYALLTHVQRQAPYQREISEWLNSQRLTSGGWASTQDTILAFQALTAYSINSERAQTSIKVSIEAPALRDSKRESRFYIKEANISKAHKLEMPNAFGIITVKAEGTGFCLVSFDIRYNVDWPQLQIKPAVKSFDLDIRPSYSGRNSSSVNMDICTRWTLLSEAPRSGMTVLEVPVPTGYMINQGTLDRLVNTSSTHSLLHIRNLREARISNRKVFFYFDFVSIKKL